jgi:hypothetical protein
MIKIGNKELPNNCSCRGAPAPLYYENPSADFHNNKLDKFAKQVLAGVFAVVSNSRFKRQLFGFWTFLWFWAFFLFSGSLYAQLGVSVDARLEKDVVAVGEQIILNVVVTLNGDGQINEPRLSDTGGLELLGKNSAVSMQSQLKSGPQGMQFEKKKIQTFIYFLAGKKEGSYSIAPIEVVVEGKAYKTKILRVEINNKEASKMAKKPKPQNNNPFGIPNPFADEDEEDSLLGQLLQNRGQQREEIPSKNLPVNTNEAFFVTVELDKKEAFEGEQIFANWYLYTRGELYQLDRMKFPALKGFWKEDIEAAPTLIYQHEIVNGVQFRKALLASHALFPISEGISVVDDYKIRATVSLPTNNFGGFAFGKPYTYTRTSGSVQVKIKPLPTENKPLSFSGAVGQFQITMRADSQEIHQWKPFVVRVRYEGEGNAKLIEMPQMPFPPSIEIYDATKSEAKYFKSGKSYKEFLVSLISKESGAVTIPPIELSYFDPITASYKVIATEPLNLNVIPGEKPADLGGERVEIPNDPANKKNKAFVMPSINKEFNEKNFYWLRGWAAFFAWSSLYLILSVFLIVLYFYQSRPADDSKDIKKWMGHRIAKIRSLLAGKQYRAVAGECLNLIYKVVGSIADEGNSGLEMYKLLEQLPPSIRRDLGSVFQKHVERWQVLAFAPEGAWGEFASDDKIQNLFSETHKSLERAVELSQQESNA